MGETILVVDDEEGIRRLMDITLTDMGYSVQTAEDGERGLAVFRSIHPAIVLLDIRMPGMDGIELLRTIKTEEPDTEVVMITGHGDLDLAIKSIKYEATDFVTKPINMDILEIALKRAKERISTRHQLREYTENLENLVEEKTKELVQAERLAEIGRIATGLAHEINNPVAAIREAAAWAGAVVVDAKGLGADDRQELEEIMEKIGAQTERCGNITHKLLGFARESRPSKSELDIHELLKETIAFLAPQLKHTNIKIDLAFAEGPLLVNSDPKLLEQVFVNLIGNAIHALLEKGGDDKYIELGTVRKDSEAEISVEDNAGGIPQEHQGKIFELFYTTKPPGKGTGLGLPISQNVVRSLGGEITFESKVGVGTTFRVRIPMS
jgi:C4-dicarboxylate-specific signal transduction histidine kinase